MSQISMINRGYMADSNTTTWGVPATTRPLLRTLDGIRPLYVLPDDPLAESVLIPCFSAASRVDSMVGFFSSEALASLAPGLATFIDTSNGHLRLIISPLLRPEDLTAIAEGVNPSEATTIAIGLLKDMFDTADFIEQHTFKCLTWLLQTGRIEIKVALMRRALFHPKVWLFGDKDDTIAVHGSSNMTYAGIQKNIEQVAVSRSWDGTDSQYTTNRLRERFDMIWADDDDNCIVVAMPEAIRDNLLKTYHSDTPPQESDLRIMLRKDAEKSSHAHMLPSSHSDQFEIPSWLQYEDGPFDHQGKAVRAWCDAGHSGVLEMATGSGKTFTSMVCAKRLSENNTPLLIVVAAPYVPLIQQWCDEIAPFGITPVNLTAELGPARRARALGRIRRQLRRERSGVKTIVISHDILCDSGFKGALSDFECATLLIADEVHNLGRAQFISNPPDFFDYRLGLSATPERQYDEAGTEEIFSFFGPVVFQLPLEEAIGKCLVSYDYKVHPVELTAEEMRRWSELTERIRAQSWRQDEGQSPDNYLAKLLRDRRAILENAENKIAALRTVLDSEGWGSLRHTLIYTSDKAPTQLEQVNSMLVDRGILFHQLTHEETADRDQTAEILKAFQEGTLRVLTAKRVLDEGVNIPQVQKAFILASTTVERQWTQRRGRLLRTCDEIDKTHSEIHDFVALPPTRGAGDSEDRSIMRSELQRVREFASLARNAARPDGPLSVIDILIEGAYL